jgi:uncharacterized membrane protein
MKQFLKSIQTYILIGGVLVTPVAVTLWVILLLVNLLSNAAFTRWLTTPIFTHLPGENITVVQALVSLFMVLGLLFCVGVIFRNFLGRRLYNFLDKLMEKTPVINRVYTFVRTVSESILSQKETMFREVVLIEYPKQDMYSVAFVSSIVPAKIQSGSKTPEEPHAFVFLPTTPNPTSGFMLMVPRSKVKKLDLTTAEAMRLIISAGATNPDDGEEASKVPSLLDKLDSMVLSQRRTKLKPEPTPNLNFGED